MWLNIIHIVCSINEFVLEELSQGIHNSCRVEGCLSYNFTWCEPIFVVCNKEGESLTLI